MKLHDLFIKALLCVCVCLFLPVRSIAMMPVSARLFVTNAVTGEVSVDQVALEAQRKEAQARYELWRSSPAGKWQTFIRTVATIYHGYLEFFIGSPLYWVVVGMDSLLLGLIAITRWMKWKGDAHPWRHLFHLPLPHHAAPA